MEVVDRRDLGQRGADGARGSGKDGANHRYFGSFGARVVLVTMSSLRPNRLRPDPVDARNTAGSERTPA
ncbi:MAG TPA: hypothetical protein VNV83_04475 [Acidimicrobiales bacterium]|jgi:hypothetical protein|nr:hypothetical protein [Acidimicrobiales bacterium]